MAEEAIIDRAEAIGIMFTITDIRETLLRIEKLLENNGEEEEQAD